MPEIPPSFGLKKKRRKDGRIDLVGKDDAGKDYTALTTETTEVTDKDVTELIIGDRENSDAYKFTNHFIEADKQNKAEFEAKVEQEDFEVVEDIMRSAYRRSPRLCDKPAGPTKVSFGTSRKLRRNWPKDWPQGVRG